MLEIFTGEASKGYLENIRQNDLKRGKYAQMKRFHYDYQIQVDMYVFIYIFTDKMADDD